MISCLANQEFSYQSGQSWNQVFGYGRVRDSGFASNQDPKISNLEPDRSRTTEIQKKVGPNRFTVENIKLSRHNCTVQFVCQKSCCMPSKMTTHYRFHLKQYQTEIVYDSTNKTNINNCFLRAILIFNNLAQHNFRRMSF